MTDVEKGISQLCDEVARLRDSNKELLEALKAISRHIDSPENFDAHINKLCDEAIAKAEGRSND